MTYAEFCDEHAAALVSSLQRPEGATCSEQPPCVDFQACDGLCTSTGVVYSAAGTSAASRSAASTSGAALACPPWRAALLQALPDGGETVNEAAVAAGAAVLQESVAPGVPSEWTTALAAVRRTLPP